MSRRRSKFKNSIPLAFQDCAGSSASSKDKALMSLAPWNMERILRGARKLRASDIHLVQGMAPVLRVNGEIRVSEGEPLTAEILQALLDEMLNDRMREAFAREWQLSFSR